MTAETDPAAPRPTDTVAARPPALLGSLAGLVAGGLGTASGSSIASFADVTTPVRAVGNVVIDNAPTAVKNLAIDLFGTADKTALQTGIVLILGVLVMVLGAASRSSPTPLLTGIGTLSIIGVVAATNEPRTTVWSVAAPLIGGAIGAAAAVMMLSALGSRWERWHRRRTTPGPSRVPLGWDRRRFVGRAALVGGAAVVAGTVAVASDRRRTQRLVAQIPDTLPAVPDTGRGSVLPEVPVEVPSYVTPNEFFYRIDTALSFPSVNLGTWTMTVHGLVDRVVELTYDDLRRRPQIERTITICCVSNEVGGPYIGNAVWQGVALADVLREAGIQPDAEQVFSRSLDGWTCGFPVAAALDGRDALIAIGMNGEPLPLEHGFPARLIVPGLYGYVSATKWLSEIEINRWDDAEGFWVPRGWSRDAPIKTHSRIDVPRSGSSVPSGTVVLAGVAWAPGVGIDFVEVRVDDGPWQRVALSEDVTDDAWRVWRFDWVTEPGTYTVQVRATDKSGYVQTDEVRPVAPDGATGWHTRRITVT